jgi:hypothetical protein
MGKRLSKKQLKKRIDKRCYFCGCDDYELLDVHRILPGEEGGKYTDWNMVTTCCMCHRKIHAGKIKVLGRYFSTRGNVIHFIDEDGQEQYR